MTPTLWPLPQRRLVKPDDELPIMRWLIYAAAGVAVIGIVIAAASRLGAATAEPPLTGTQRATNGLFIAGTNAATTITT